MEGEEQLIKDRLQELIEGIKALGHNSYVVKLTKEIVNELQQRGVYCIERFIQKLSDRVNDKEAYLDILMEGRIATILARNKFSQIHIEYSEGCPDLKAKWNKSTVYFEVTRKRPSDEDQLFSQPGVHIVLSPRTENTIEKIRSKLRQLEPNEINIVVLCSETVQLGRSDVEEAFKYIELEIHNDTDKYKDLSAVLFTESVEEFVKGPWGLYLFKNANALKPLGTRLAVKLESLGK